MVLYVNQERGASIQFHDFHAGPHPYGREIDASAVSAQFNDSLNHFFSIDLQLDFSPSLRRHGFLSVSQSVHLEFCSVGKEILIAKKDGAAIQTAFLSTESAWGISVSLRSVSGQRRLDPVRGGRQFGHPHAAGVMDGVDDRRGRGDHGHLAHTHGAVGSAIPRRLQ